MRRFLVSTALVAVLAATAPAVPASATPPAPPADSSPAAARALEKVQEILSGQADHGAGADHADHGDATMAFVELAQQYDRLDPADRRTAQDLMARPDADEDDPATDENEDIDEYLGGAWTQTERDAALMDCSDPRFCVHWVPSGTMVDGAYSLHNSTSAEVEQTIAAMKVAWDRETLPEESGGLGFNQPLGDGTRGGDGEQGTSGQVDVYLADLSDRDGGLLGYAIPEQDATTSEGYMVVENDFDESTSSVTEAAHERRATVAHELFHLIQFTYDLTEAAWLFESTAAWSEEQVFDDANQNLSSLPASSMRNPWLPLDSYNEYGTHYGNWVFHELTTQRLGLDTVRQIWEQAQDFYNPRSLLETVYKSRGSSLANEFRMFTAASLAPSRYWDEGSTYYPAATMSKNWTLGTGKKSIGYWKATIDHLAATDFVVKPDSSLSGNWKFRLKVDGYRDGTTGYAMVVYKGGRIGTSPLTFDSSTGNLTRSFPFSSSEVSRVAISLGNSTHFNDRTISFSGAIWR